MRVSKFVVLAVCLSASPVFAETDAAKMIKENNIKSLQKSDAEREERMNTAREYMKTKFGEGASTGGMDKKSYMETIDKSFDMLDRNNDGKLDASEMPKIQSSGERVSSQIEQQLAERKKALNKTSDNKSGIAPLGGGRTGNSKPAPVGIPPINAQSQGN